MIQKTILRFIIPVWIVFALSACTSMAVPEANSLTSADATVGERSDGVRVVANLPPPPSSASGEQPLAPNDILKVDVFQVDELDRTVQISANGEISLPLIGKVQAAGKSASELEQSIAASYSRSYLQNPQVNVFVTESSAQKVTVDGEVKKPGLFNSTLQSSLTGMVAQAGGLTDIADSNRVYVFRNIGPERVVANYSLKDIRKGERNDPRLYGGDVVVIFPSGGRVAMRNLKEALGLATSGVTGIARGGALIP
ncbi:polysaccharide biosynthesis/export family protein [Notoacmeibacter marinus]|uniref:polysaccharide biosynthesis/export family protein n=1 Tax=Notoacmeibacter marinus TaxID=1876515 RepID=UPI0013B05E51|nr:polysaccharide biosynthesis/export family protein [Notoacmeibacter marinus]